MMVSIFIFINNLAENVCSHVHTEQCCSVVMYTRHQKQMNSHNVTHKCSQYILIYITGTLIVPWNTHVDAWNNDRT